MYVHMYIVIFVRENALTSVRNIFFLCCTFRLSVWLRSHEVITLPMLEAGFRDCSQTPAEASSLETIYDFAEWLTPHIQPMQHHSRPHCFKIVPDEAGKALLLTKTWSTDQVNVCT